MGKILVRLAKEINLGTRPITEILAPHGIHIENRSNTLLTDEMIELVKAEVEKGRGEKID